MAHTRSYTDEALVAAVKQNHSWRAVLRTLGLIATSSTAIRSIRHRADLLGCDYSHFRGQRTWDEPALREAVSTATSWQEVTEALGLVGGSSLTTIKGHVTRLGIDAAHLAPAPRATRPVEPRGRPDPGHLSGAGSLLAAGWFALSGYQISWPLEPCRYDLLVEREGAIERIQVKTTTVRTGSSWTVWLSTTSGQRTPYATDEIDSFFVIDGDLNYHLIPVGRVGGLHAIALSAYESFRLPGSGNTWPWSTTHNAT